MERKNLLSGIDAATSRTDPTAATSSTNSAPSVSSVDSVTTTSRTDQAAAASEPGFFDRVLRGGPFTTEAFTDLAKKGAAPVNSRLVDPKAIMEDTSIDPDTRLEAANAVAQQEAAALNAEIFERSKKAQKYLNAVKTAEELNSRLSQRYGADSKKLVKIPSPESFGISAADVVTYQAQVSGEKQDTGISGTQTKANADLQEEMQRNQLMQIQREQANLIEQDLARQTAAIAAQANYSNKMRQLMDEKIAAIDAQQEELDKIDPNRFWNSKSAPQQILGALAVAMGSAGAALTGSNSNVALDIINDAIKRDFDAQKITGDQRLLKEQNALRRIEAEINKFSQLSQDNLRKSELQKLQMDLRAKQMEIRQTLARNQMIKNFSSDEGIPPEMVDLFADDKLRDRLVPLPNGNFGVAVGEEQAKLARKNLDKLEPGLKSLRDIQQFYKNFNKFSILDQSRLASELAVNFSAVKQAMSEVGALTENDIKRIEKALGNPSILPTVLAEVKVASLIANAEGKRDVVYKQAGIKVPQTERQKYRNLMKQRNSKLSDEAIEAELDRRGYK